MNSNLTKLLSAVHLAPNWKLLIKLPIAIIFVSISWPAVVNFLKIFPSLFIVGFTNVPSLKGFSELDFTIVIFLLWIALLGHAFGLWFFLVMMDSKNKMLILLSPISLIVFPILPLLVASLAFFIDKHVAFLNVLRAFSFVVG